MSKNKEIGVKGEALAVDYLIKKGFTVLEKNFTYGRYEIDIIAKTENTLVFVEVKTRQSIQYGYPHEAVDDKKIDHILECADHYIYQTQWEGSIRFDIISVLLKPKLLIEHLEDAFY